MNSVIYLLIFQGMLGGYDVLWNHEWKEKLPTKPTAALEQKIHGIRELFYAVVFIGLAWREWGGMWAWVLLSVIVIEVILTAWDFVIEDKTRVLSPNERIAHLILSMTGGAYVALLIPVLLDWSYLPYGFVSVEYGFRSWVLTIFGIGVFAWGVRDIWSGLALSKNNPINLSVYPLGIDSKDKVVLFDGECKLCNAWAKFLIKFDKHHLFKLASVQSEEGKAILQWCGLPIDYYETMLLVEGAVMYQKSTAFIRVMLGLPFPWKIVACIWIIPAPLRDWFYDRIALNRYQLFGKYDTCMIPTPDHLSRYLNVK